MRSISVGSANWPVAPSALRSGSFSANRCLFLMEKTMAKESNLAIVHSFTTITLGALASLDAVVVEDGKIDASRLEGFRLIKTQYWMDYKAKTANEGPVLIGFAMNQNAAEIEEALEADPQQRADIPEGEQTMRPVFPLEVVPFAPTSQVADGFAVRGEQISRWSMPEGKGLSWFAYNFGPAVLTTGGIIVIYAKHFGVWLRD